MHTHKHTPHNCENCWGGLPRETGRRAFPEEVGAELMMNWTAYTQSPVRGWLAVGELKPRP